MKGLLKIYQFFFAKIALAMLVFTLCRILFWQFNSSLIGPVDLSAFIGGLQYDIMAISWVYAPFILLHLFLYHQIPKVVALLFHLSNAFCIILNAIDLEYYTFTLKRTGSELFQTKGLANDMLVLLPQYVKDFWYIILLIALLIGFSIWAYRKIEKNKPEPVPLKTYMAFLIPSLLLLAIGSRGGVQLRPLSILSASQHASGNGSAVVLNTPFTILKSSYKKKLEKLNYFSQEEADALFNPRQYFNGDSNNSKKNVVLLILESFSKEYMGAYGQQEGYTPFLDSLLNHSLHFSHAYANGKKSIEALPAILSGIPSIMDKDYISSKYAGNPIGGIAYSLNKKGYTSSFYHGGENGTMGFDAFAYSSGISRYIGKNEYPSASDYDGNWGVFDEPFLSFCLRDLNQQEQPFFASIFTLSSHHPYAIPNHLEDQFESGPIPILKSIRYADYALKQFFESAVKQAWFEETIFVLTADHTGPSISESAATRTGIYEIPLAFYAPKYIQPKLDERIVQQTDIYPSLIDLLGIEANLVAFGNSVFDSTKTRFAINQINESYQLIESGGSLISDGKKPLAFYDLNQDPLMQNNLVLEKSAKMNNLNQRFKAIHQQFNQSLIQNQLRPNDNQE